VHFLNTSQRLYDRGKGKCITKNEADVLKTYTKPGICLIIYVPTYVKKALMIRHHPDRDQIRLEHVLAALGNPMRMTVVRVLADGSEHTCGSVLKGVSKSTLTHHWRVLRDSGVIWQTPSGRENLLSLRKEDLEARFPGLLTSFLAATEKDKLTGETVRHFNPDV
jgi:DNA-binding transcriptional ArsR family regulator